MNLDQELFYVFFGVFFFAFGIIKFIKGKSLSENGEVVNGIVFRIDNKMSIGDDENRVEIIRFVTKKKEWITEELTSTSLIPRSVGDKVKIIYNPENPKEFDIQSDLNLMIVPIIFVAIGAIVIIYGIISYLNIELYT